MAFAAQRPGQRQQFRDRFTMGEGSAASSAGATVHTKRKAIPGGNSTGTRASATTPTSLADGAASKKRPRSETPSDPAAAGAGAGERANNENQNNVSTSTSGNTGVKKKKKHNTIGGIGDSSSSSLTFEEAIAFASSKATVGLLELSLPRLTDGIPKRELKLIVTEARVCEVALENEIRILNEGLKLERQKKQKQNNMKKEEITRASTNNSPDVADATVAVAKKASNDTTSLKPTDVDPPASGDDKQNSGTNKAEDDSPTTTSTTSTSALTPKEITALETMLKSEFTPPDTHWTLSALLGRLRHELTTPLPPRSQLPAHREKQGLTQLAQNVGMTSQSTYKKRGPKAAAATGTTIATATASASGGSATATVTAGSGTGTAGKNDATTISTTAASSVISKKTPNEASATSATTSSVTAPPSQSLQTEASQFKRLGSLPDHVEYRRDHATPDKLLTVWKKLSTHRSSLVFRRPVNPKEAPGYTDRIRFPMDLSLMRKLIQSKHVQNYEGILKQVHLIGHNCVKYNGKESDYALVTREFESVATEYIWTAVMRETYGGSRGRWSRNSSPMPPSSSTAPASLSSATPSPAAAAGGAAPKPAIASTATATSGRTPATTTQKNASSAT